MSLLPVTMNGSAGLYRHAVKADGGLYRRLYLLLYKKTTPVFTGVVLHA